MDHYKPKIFIGSSKEKKEFADDLQVKMRDWANAEVWDEIFDVSETTIVNLENKLPKFDICVFLWTADDMAKIRGNEVMITRDNLIFETGLSVAYIGRKNTIIVMGEETKILSDLFGVTSIIHDFSQNINIVATQIRKHYNKNIDLKIMSIEDLEELLIKTLQSEELSNRQTRHYAWVCAVRALPFLFYGNLNFWKRTKLQKNLFAIFNALDCAAMNNYTNAKVGVIAAADNRATYVAAAAADAAAFEAFPYTSNAYAASAASATGVAAAAASAARSTYSDTAFSTKRSTYDAVAYSSYAAYSCNFIGLYHKILINDIKLIKNNQLDRLEGQIDLYGDIWNNFEIILKDIGCEYWFQLYDKVFQSNFKLDVDELRIRLNLPNAEKNKSALAVAQYMNQYK